MILSIPWTVKGETISDSYNLGNKTVPPNKEWTINFNLPVVLNDNNKNCIAITNSNGTAVPVGEYLSSDKKSIIVTPPEGGYTCGQTYELDVKKGLVAENNSILSRPSKLNFLVNKNTNAISAIKNVEDTIKLAEGSTYKLNPSAADANGNTVNGAIFSYKSSNTSVAEVSSTGIITPVSDGSAIIDITCGTINKEIIVNVSSELSIKDIAKNSNAVVYIEVSNQNKQPIASGSGFIIKSDGTIVTNYHVIDGASYAKVTLEDGRQYDVDKVLAASREHDLAILKLKNASDLPVVALGDSGKLSPGDEIIAIGSPGGLQLQNTITEGIVSGFRPTSRLASNEKDIQISASISHGSSGGALFNSLGQVVGVTYAGSEQVTNANFAIPINELTPFLSQNINKTLLELANTPDAAPAGLKYTLRNGCAVISWNANAESDVKGYYLYESSNSRNGFSRVYVSDGWFGRTNLIDGTAVKVLADPGETYYFYVTAVNTKGVESGKSNIISVTF